MQFHRSWCRDYTTRKPASNRSYALRSASNHKPKREREREVERKKTLYVIAYIYIYEVYVYDHIQSYKVYIYIYSCVCVYVHLAQDECNFPLSLFLFASRVLVGFNARCDTDLIRRVVLVILTATRTIARFAACAVCLSARPPRQHTSECECNVWINFWINWAQK